MVTIASGRPFCIDPRIALHPFRGVGSHFLLYPSLYAYRHPREMDREASEWSVRLAHAERRAARLFLRE